MESSEISGIFSNPAGKPNFDHLRGLIIGGGCYQDVYEIVFCDFQFLLSVLSGHLVTLHFSVDVPLSVL